jgi:hypothetical protein
VRIVGTAADKVGLGVDGGEAPGVDPADDPLNLTHNLGPDAVAGEQQQVVSFHALRHWLP